MREKIDYKRVRKMHERNKIHLFAKVETMLNFTSNMSMVIQSFR